jgi:hypothetical protein
MLTFSKLAVLIMQFEDFSDQLCNARNGNVGKYRVWIGIETLGDH